MPEAIVTPFFRLSFPDLFEPKPVSKQKPDVKKFGIQMIFIDQRPVYEAFNKLGDLIPAAGAPESEWTQLQKDYAKDPTLLIQVRRHLVECCRDKWGQEKDKWPMPWKQRDLSSYISEDGKNWPIRNGDMVSWNGFAGHMFASAKANEDRKPGIARLNPRDTRPVEKTEIFGGLIVRANINGYAWHNSEGGHGVSLGLNHVQIVLDDGVRFGGAAAPLESAFGAFGDEEMFDTQPAASGEGVSTADDF